MKNKTSNNCKTDSDAEGLASAKTIEPSGKLVPLKLLPMREFKNGYELIYIMRDAVEVHGEYHEKTGKLHGDVNTRHLMILETEQDDNAPRHGVLLYLD